MYVESRSQPGGNIFQTLCMRSADSGSYVIIQLTRYCSLTQPSPLQTLQYLWTSVLYLCPMPLIYEISRILLSSL